MAFTKTVIHLSERKRYPGFRCSDCGWRIGTKLLEPPPHHCPAPKSAYPDIACQQCNTPRRPWAIYIFHETEGTQVRVCNPCRQGMLSPV